jgi:hypothetical protein
MAWGEAAAVVAEPDVVAGLAEIEGEGGVVVGAVSASRLEEAVDHKNGVFFLLRFSIIVVVVVVIEGFGRPARGSAGEDGGPASAALGFRKWREITRVVDVPEVDDETVFGLDLEFFDVEADSARIVGDVAD